MESGSIFLYFSIFFALISLCSLFLTELKDSKQKVFFEKIIPHAGIFILSSLILLSIAAIQLIYYIVNSDFSIQYVWQYTSKDLPLAYKISAFWMDEAGSMMFLSWVILSIAYWLSTRQDSETMFKRRILMVILLIGILFITFTALLSPFNVNSDKIPEDGVGLNPVLINKWMILYFQGILIAYGILVVVFASAIIHHFDKDWEIFSRPYARISWMTMGMGMIAGIIWSYEVRENYWIYDTAFASILMTWLLLTAYLHSSGMHRKNRGQFLSPAIAVNVFISAIYSIYIIQSKTFNSIDLFGEGSIKIMLILSLILVAILLEGALVYRYFSLRQNQVYRRSESLFNNDLLFVTIILFMGLAFIQFLGLNASLFIENPGSSFSLDLYGKWSYPLLIALIAILGICMSGTVGKNRIKGIIIGAVLLIFFLLTKPAENISFNIFLSVLIFAGLGSVYQLFKSLHVAGIKKKLCSSASILVHVGIVVMLIGVLMSTYTTSETVLFMKLNEKKTVGGYEIQLVNLAFPVEHKHATAILTKIAAYNIYKDGIRVDFGEAKFREIKGELITEPLIYRGLLADVHVRYQGIGTQSPKFISVANVRIIPGMTILWLGSFLAVCGIIPLIIWRKINYI